MMSVVALGELYLTFVWAALASEIGGDHLWAVLGPLARQVGSDALTILTVVLGLLGALFIAQVLPTDPLDQRRDSGSVGLFAYGLAGTSAAVVVLAAVGTLAPRPRDYGMWSIVALGAVSTVVALWLGLVTFGSRRRLRRLAGLQLQSTGRTLLRYAESTRPASRPVADAVRVTVLTGVATSAIALALALLRAPREIAPDEVAVMGGLFVLLTTLGVISAWFACVVKAARIDMVRYAWVGTATTGAVAGGVVMTAVLLGLIFSTAPLGNALMPAVFVSQVLPLFNVLSRAGGGRWSLTAAVASADLQRIRRRRLELLRDLYVLRKRRHRGTWVALRGADVT